MTENDTHRRMVNTTDEGTSSWEMSRKWVKTVVNEFSGLFWTFGGIFAKFKCRYEFGIPKAISSRNIGPPDTKESASVSKLADTD